jgi:hypothetical protein
MRGGGATATAMAPISLPLEGMGLDALGLFPQFMPDTPSFTLLRWAKVVRAW